MGYVEPTPIQLRAMPLILDGKDVIGSAQTGTGKTAAFALPILSKLGHHSPGPRLLVLEPTRELAAQVETAIHDFARFTNLRTAVIGPDARVATIYSGNDWTAEQVVADLRRALSAPAK